MTDSILCERHMTVLLVHLVISDRLRLGMILFMR
jgi:hypothetical protein